MNRQSKEHTKLLFSVLLIISIKAGSQSPHFSSVPSLDPRDSTGITQLLKNGTKVTKGKVIGWFPKDSLSMERMNRILDTLNIGITAAEKFINVPQPWQIHQKGEPYTFYFRRDSFVSHASGAGFVSIPFWRIKQGKAPWLHEVLHEILNTKVGDWDNASVSEEVRNKNMPLWLMEGLPDYISLWVSQQINLPLFDVFTNSFLTNVDSLCKADLKSPKADSILSFVGTKGILLGLLGEERRFYARVFYHCSCSFVKYLAEQKGVVPLVMSLAAYPKETETLERRMGFSLVKAKRQWLTKLNGR